jgi:hypothetical protein
MESPIVELLFDHSVNPSLSPDHNLQCNGGIANPASYDHVTFDEMAFAPPSAIGVSASKIELASLSPWKGEGD